MYTRIVKKQGFAAIGVFLVMSLLLVSSSLWPSAANPALTASSPRTITPLLRGATPQGPAVQGQSDLQGTSISYHNAGGLALDSSVQPSRFYVADTSNNRVLGWASVKDFQAGAAPGIVLGQPDFGTLAANSRGISSESLSHPVGVAVDKAGNLIVADAGNNRVLRFDSPFTTDTAADLVWGQDSFTDNQPRSKRAGFDYPIGVAVGTTTANGEFLYVTDQGNKRVVVYHTTDTTPVNVLENEAFKSPAGIAVTQFFEELFVTDSGTNKVFVYTDASTTPTLTRVIDKVGKKVSKDASKIPFKGIGAIAASPTGGFYLADSANGRVIEFTTPTNEEDFDADRIFGASDVDLYSPFAKNFRGTPLAVAIDRDGSIYVSDASSGSIQVLPSPNAPVSQSLPTDSSKGGLDVNPNAFPGTDTFNPAGSYVRVPTGINNLWQITISSAAAACTPGTGGDPINNAGHTGPNCAGFRNNASCSIASPNVSISAGELRSGTGANVCADYNLTGICGGATLNLNYFLRTAPAAFGTRQAFIEMRTSATQNFAGGFTVIASNQGVGVPLVEAATNTDPFTAISIPLTGAAGQFLQFRWRFSAVNNTGINANSRGFFVDDIQVVANNNPPTVNITVDNATPCQGDTVTFTANATSANTFQWRKDGIDIPGATSNTLVLTGVQGSDSGNYTCFVTNNCGSTLSNTIALGVTVQPQHLNITATPNPYCAVGDIVAITGVVSGADEYRLQRSIDGGVTWTNIGGIVATPTFNRTTVAADNGAFFRVLGRNTPCFDFPPDIDPGDGDPAASPTDAIPGVPTIQLTLTAAITAVNIVASPGTTVCEGGTLQIFSTPVGGTPSTFQWQLNGGPLTDGFTPGLGTVSGANTGTLTISGIVAGTGDFDLLADNNCTADPGVTSNTVTVTIDPAAVADQTCFDADCDGAVTLCEGDSGTFSDLGITAPGPGITYFLLRSPDGIAPFVPVAGPSATPAFPYTAVLADNGAQYRVRVVTSCGNADADPAVLTVNPASPGTADTTVSVDGGAPQTSPPPVQACSGATLVFTIPTIPGATSYQWRQAGVDLINGPVGLITISGAQTTTLTITNVQDPTSDGVYRCFVMHPCGNFQSTGVNVNVIPGPVATQTCAGPGPTECDGAVTLCPGNYIFDMTGGFTPPGPGVTYTLQRSPDGVAPFVDLAGPSASPTFLNIPVAFPADNGARYRIRVTTGTCNSADALPLTLTVTPPPPATLNTTVEINNGGQTPGPADACETDTVVFRVPDVPGATGYVWRQNGVAFATDNGTLGTGGFTGAFTRTLTLLNIDTMAAGDYDVQVMHPCAPGGMFFSAPAITLTVTPDLDGAIAMVATSPTCEGSTVIFSLDPATTTNATNFQWQYSLLEVGPYSNIIGAVASTYTISPTDQADTGFYRCVVSNTCSLGATSTAVALVVNATLPPTITTVVTPVVTSICEGQSATFSVPTFAGATYQWRLNGVAFPTNDGTMGAGSWAGATTNTLLISNVDGSFDAGDPGEGYDCVVTAAPGCVPPTVTSSLAPLRVNELVVAPVVTTAIPDPPDVCSAAPNNDVTLTVPTFIGATYQWYRGLNPVANGGNIAGATTEVLTITDIVPGQQGAYRCLITPGGGGACGPGIFSQTQTVTISDPLPTPITASFVVDGLPTPDNPELVCEGANVNIVTTPALAPAPGLTFEWFFNGVSLITTPVANVTGADTATLTITGALDPENTGMYQLTVTNPCGPVMSTIATLTVVPDTPVLTTTINETSGVANDGIVCAAPGVVVNFVCTGGPAPGPGVTYEWVFNGGPAALANGASPIGTISGADTPTLTITDPTFIAAGTYFCRLTTVCGLIASNIVTLQTNQTLLPGFDIVANPSESVCIGQDLTLTAPVPVGGFGPGTTLQWTGPGGALVDGPVAGGGSISGSTTPVLTLNDVTVNFAGDYSLTIMNACGPVTSEIVPVVVNAAVTVVADPPAQNIPTGNDAVFTATISDPTATTQWFFDADCGGVGAAVAITNDGVNYSIIDAPGTSTLTILAATAADSGCYFLRATSAQCGIADSNLVQLIINGAEFPVVYVADTANNRIQRTTNGGVTWTVLGTGKLLGGSAQGDFRAPEAVAVDPGDNPLDPADDIVYVADTQNNRIQVGINGGLLPADWSTLAINGTTIDRVKAPFGITVDIEGNVYISDTNNFRVIRYLGGVNAAATNQILATGGTGAGQVSIPHGLAIDFNFNLYIADQGSNSRVLKIVNANTVVVTNTGLAVATSGTGAANVKNPQGVACDSAGNLFIADTGNNRVKLHPAPVNTPAGAGVILTNGNGTALGQTRAPEGVTLAQFTDPTTPVGLRNAVSIIICDTLNNRVQGKLNPFTPAPAANWVLLGGQGTVAGQFKSPSKCR